MTMRSSRSLLVSIVLVTLVCLWSNNKQDPFGSSLRSVGTAEKSRALSGGAGTDDHSGLVNEHAAGHPALFLALSAIHIEIGTYAVFIIIGFILVLKHIIEGLASFTEDTPFSGMVSQIEEELMIVGTSSFLFKVILNTTNFGTNEWAYPLEFAEILVPLIAFSYCGLGILVIFISLKQCYSWSRAHNLKALEILDDYFEATRTFYFSFVWKPLITSIEQLEFRIFHSLFCSAFHIQKGAFAFDEYVTKVFQRFVLELIEIRLLDWFYVITFLCLNLLRIKLKLHYFFCDEGDTPCDDRRNIYLFTIIGSFLFGFSIILLVISRRLELSLMRKHGITSHLHYAKYIETSEKQDHAKDNCLDTSALKEVASKARDSRSSKRGSVMANSSSGSNQEEFGVSGKQRAKPVAGGASEKFLSSFSNSNKVTPSNAEQLPPLYPTPSGEYVDSSRIGSVEDFNSAAVAPAIVSVPAPTSNDGAAGGAAAEEKSQENIDMDTIGFDHTTTSAKTMQISEKVTKGDSQPINQPPLSVGELHRALSTMKSDGRTDHILGKHSESIMDVFWLGRPEIFFESVQLLFMIVSLYLAMWFTVMVSSAPTAWWKFLSIAPAILICCFFFYIVKTAALLKAIYVVDTDALLEVIEETESAKQLSEELRTKVIEHVSKDGADPYKELERFYKVIDGNGNNSLSRREFGQFMDLMGISFSVKKWERIYKEVDRNYDNEISLQEFYLFLFPDHDEAMRLEMKRLKAISNRVRLRADKILASLSPFREKSVHSPGKPVALEAITSKVATSTKAMNKFKSLKASGAAARASATSVVTLSTVAEVSGSAKRETDSATPEEAPAGKTVSSTAKGAASSEPEPHRAANEHAVEPIERLRSVDEEGASRHTSEV